MSTRRGLYRPPRMAASPVAMEQIRALGKAHIGHRYRCVYCKRHFAAVEYLPAHAAMCDARYVVERSWAMAIERARQRYAQTGLL